MDAVGWLVGAARRERRAGVGLRRALPQPGGMREGWRRVPALVNKIKPSKMEVVKHYFGKALHDRCAWRACVRATASFELIS